MEEKNHLYDCSCDSQNEECEDLNDIIRQEREALEMDFKKTLNSGKRMYEIGRKDEREALLKEILEEIEELKYDPTADEISDFTDGHDHALEKALELIKKKS